MTRWYTDEELDKYIANLTKMHGNPSMEDLPTEEHLAILTELKLARAVVDAESSLELIEAREAYDNAKRKAEEGE